MNITCGNCKETSPLCMWEIIDDGYWCPVCKLGVRRTAGPSTKLGSMIIPGEIKLEVVEK